MTSTCQFHQHFCPPFMSEQYEKLFLPSISLTFFARVFCTNFFCQSQNITRKSCWNYCRMKNSYLKTLMKLTLGEQWMATRFGKFSRDFSLKKSQFLVKLNCEFFAECYEPSTFRLAHKSWWYWPHPSISSTFFVCFFVRTSFLAAFLVTFWLWRQIFCTKNGHVNVDEIDPRCQFHQH
jgi:hypothetical protein